MDPKEWKTCRSCIKVWFLLVLEQLSGRKCISSPGATFRAFSRLAAGPCVWGLLQGHTQLWPWQKCSFNSGVFRLWSSRGGTTQHPWQGLVFPHKPDLSPLKSPTLLRAERIPNLDIPRRVSQICHESTHLFTIPPLHPIKASAQSITWHWAIW